MAPGLLQTKSSPPSGGSEKRTAAGTLTWPWSDAECAYLRLSTRLCAAKVPGVTSNTPSAKCPLSSGGGGVPPLFLDPPEDREYMESSGALWMETCALPHTVLATHHASHDVFTVDMDEIIHKRSWELRFLNATLYCYYSY